MLEAAIGACIGSACSTIAIRSARGEAFIAGRSHCDACGRSLGFADTLPLFSFAWRRGACARCGAKIDLTHPMGEIAGSLVALIAWNARGPSEAAILSLMGFVLIVAAVYDTKTLRLPDVLTFLVFVACLTLAALKGAHGLVEGVLCATVTFAVLTATSTFFSHARSRVGLGFGDVKLLSSLAVWLGVSTPYALLVAALLGLLAAAASKRLRDPLPFGPFLAISAWPIGALHLGLDPFSAATA